MDRVDRQKRSWIMKQVKSHGNKSTEVKFVCVAKSNSITGWRRNSRLIGKPDFIFPRARLALFLDGCFWHGHPQLCRLPATNQKYWLSKIERNIARDQYVNRQLRNRGWSVLRIWENEIESPRTIKRIQDRLKKRLIQRGTNL